MSFGNHCIQLRVGKRYISGQAELYIIMTKLCHHYVPDCKICTRVSY